MKNKEIYVNIQWDEKKQKKVPYFGKTWGTLEKKDSNATAIFTGDGLVVVDIDTKDLNSIDPDLVKLLPKKPTVETNRGYHYYFKHNDGAEYLSTTARVKQVDIRGVGGVVFNSYRGDSKHISYKKIGKIHKLTSELSEWLSAKKEHTKSTYTGTELSKKEVKNLLTYIPISNYSDRDSWMRVIASIYDALGARGEKVARRWSMGDSKQYDEGSFDSIWSQLERGQYGSSISVGTLVHEATKNGYARPGDFTKIDKISVIDTKHKAFEKLEPILTEFDINLLPKDAQKFVSQGAKGLDNSPLSMFAVGVMIILGNAIGRRVGVRVKQHDNWTEYPNFWGALIAPPSFKKSPIIKEVGAPLKVAEGRANDRHKEELLKYKRNMNTYNLDKSIFDKNYKAGDTSGIMPEKPEAPIRKRHIIDDATVESVGQIMVDNPNGLLLLKDELSGFFSRLTAANREGDRSFWLEAYTHQKNLNIDRIGRGNMIIPHVIAGIFGSIQPDVIQKIIYDTKSGSTGGDGLLQRFQLAVMETKNDYEFTDAGIKPAHRESYFNLVNKILKRNPEIHGAKIDEYAPFKKDIKDEDKIFYYRFSKEATEVYKVWSEENNKKITKEEKHNPALASHFGKYNGTFAKLALVLFYCDRVTGKIKDNTIHERYAKKAIEWIQFLESHARVIYDMGEIEKKKIENIDDKIITKVQELSRAEKLPIYLGTLSRSVRGADKEICKKALRGIAIIKGSEVIRLL